MTLYFAYGSNLDAVDVNRFARERGFAPMEWLGERAWLPDYRPVFHYRSESRGGGALDVMPETGCVTPGALFELDGAAHEVLALKEGAGVRYRRQEIVATTESGELRRAFTYVVMPNYRQGFVAPTRDYLNAVRRGYQAFGHTQTCQPKLEQIAGAPAGHPPLGNFFVYGTLMRGECRAHYLRDSEVSGALLRGAALFDLGEYPGIRLGHDSRVKGELHRLSSSIPSMLRRLDEMEDFLGHHDLLADAPRSLYARTIVHAGQVRAWTYALVRPPDRSSLIQSGSWRSSL